ncbi:hypothetical protein GCM10007276_17190 [Agaricicola taiwanensis]|uniref:Lysozyme inhibitor LprI-like N-terminal domain-containing protein n=1 Tax=Agaricicola taiwanensis TaxID=591372 RepID=A0A8J2VX96_9RHOB|nr:lysozyme inhibitor LprI family protein [Agaricicola taiwanensis]GGE40416.1 hypothetical protein GCM10007276_17190 [Agaricicola taiwanensis]
MGTSTILRSMVLVWLVVSLPGFAHAQDKCAKALDQASMNACAAAAFKASDVKLNDLYKQIRQRLQGQAEAAKGLVSAQRAWVAFRDAECSFASSAVEGGSVYPMTNAMCRDGLTQQRIADFERYLNCEEGDMSCPVSAGN